MISTLARHFLADVAKHLPPINTKTSESLSQLQDQLQIQLESALNKMNIVSRDEFTTQTAILTRTQNQVEELTQQLLELEKRMADKTSTSLSSADNSW
ncbi:MAG: BMFP domain-containing protein YqiC [Candidatus Endobugula sp.]|jgi:BMFP domain-containing protein YqiC